MCICCVISLKWLFWKLNLHLLCSVFLPSIDKHSWVNPQTLKIVISEGWFLNCQSGTPKVTTGRLLGSETALLLSVVSRSTLQSPAVSPERSMNSYPPKSPSHFLELFPCPSLHPWHVEPFGTTPLTFFIDFRLQWGTEWKYIPKVHFVIKAMHKRKKHS